MGQANTVHHIMFDIDGTLVKSCDFDEECFISAVAEALGHEIDSNWDNYQHVSDAGILNEHLDRRGVTSGGDEAQRSVKEAFIAKVKAYLSENPATEVAGAAKLISYLAGHSSVSLSIATGGWGETALLKLRSAGIDVSGIPMASSNDHYARIRIMKAAMKKANVGGSVPVTYFGDAAWDKKACRELGFNFVLVGDRIKHHQSVENFKNTKQIRSLIGM